MRSKNYQNLYLDHKFTEYKLNPGIKIDKHRILFQGEPVKESAEHSLKPMYFVVETNCINRTKKHYYFGKDAKSATDSSEKLKFSSRGIDGFGYSWFGLYTNRKENLSAIEAKNGILKGVLKDFFRLFFPEIEHPSLTHLRKVPAQFLAKQVQNFEKT